MKHNPFIFADRVPDGGRLTRWALAGLLALLVACGGNSSGSGSGSGGSNNPGGDGSLSGVDLSSALTTPGSLVNLPTNGAAVSGVVVDLDADNIGDGLDISGDEKPNMVYLSGDVGAGTVNQLSRAATSGSQSFGFYLAGDPSQTPYYFVLSEEEQIVISITPEAGGQLVTIVINEDGSVAGLDTTGDGQVDAGQEFIGGIIPAFSGESVVLNSACFVGTWIQNVENSGGEPPMQKIKGEPSSGYSRQTVQAILGGGFSGVRSYTFNQNGSYSFTEDDGVEMVNTENGTWKIFGPNLRLRPTEYGYGGTLEEAQTNSMPVEAPYVYETAASCGANNMTKRVFRPVNIADPEQLSGTWQFTERYYLVDENGGLILESILGLVRTVDPASGFHEQEVFTNFIDYGTGEPLAEPTVDVYDYYTRIESIDLASNLASITPDCSPDFVECGGPPLDAHWELWNGFWLDEAPFTRQ